MIYAGIDLGGTTIKIGLVEDGFLQDFIKIDAESSDSFKPRLKSIERVINNLLEKNKISIDNFGGVGVAFPSIVDSDRNKILTKYVKFTDADSIDLNQWARENWNVKLALENDARAALIGEWQFGIGKGKNHLVMMTFGTGVGSAALIDGKLLKGAHYVGGNLGGHMVINYKGNKCNCGLTGCLESEASGWSLPSLVKNINLKESALSSKNGITYKSIFKHAGKGDKIANQIKDHSLHAWSAGLINLVHAFDPELIIVGGGIMNSHELIIPYLQLQLDQDSWLPARIEIAVADHVETAGILGMAYLASQTM